MFDEGNTAKQYKAKNSTAMKPVFLQLDFIKVKYRPFHAHKLTAEYAKNEILTVTLHFM